MKVRVDGFDQPKDLYESDADFCEMRNNCASKDPQQDFHVQDGYLFKGSRLCVPQGSLRVWIIEEQHGGR